MHTVLPDGKGESDDSQTNYRRMINCYNSNVFRGKYISLDIDGVVNVPDYTNDTELSECNNTFSDASIVELIHFTSMGAKIILNTLWTALPKDYTHLREYFRHYGLYDSLVKPVDFGLQEMKGTYLLEYLFQRGIHPKDVVCLDDSEKGYEFFIDAGNFVKINPIYGLTSHYRSEIEKIFYK